MILLLSNVALILSGALAPYCPDKFGQPNFNLWLIMKALYFCLYVGALTIGHWMFSYEYYNMVRIIPFVLNDIAPPESILKSNRVQFWVWIGINMIVAFLGGVAKYFFLFYYAELACVNTYNRENLIKSFVYFTGVSLILCILAIIYGLYLGFAIFHIKQLINKKKLQVNTKIMLIHSATFFIYVISTIVCALTRINPKDLKHILLSLAFYSFCSTMTEGMICYIFWNMNNIQFVPVPSALETNEEEVATEEAIEEVRVERTDSEFDLQLRMWQQFMRVDTFSVYQRSRTSLAVS